jgi:hypothetical protein
MQVFQNMKVPDSGSVPHGVFMNGGVDHFVQELEPSKVSFFGEP